MITSGPSLPDTDSRSLFHFPPYCRIRNFKFISISHAVSVTTLHEMTDGNKLINAQHFGSDPANIRIQIRINTEIQI